MNEVDLISLAAFLHDIGKFGQRAEIYKDEVDVQNFCPQKNGHFSHLHAAYTARILGDLIVGKQEDMSGKRIKRIIEIKKEDDTLKKDFINISAKHHIPETKNEWIVASADRLASGFEREFFEEYNEKAEEETKKNYKNQQLDHLFKKDKFPIDKLDVDNIFPTQNEGIGYKELWKEFEEDIKKINTKIPNFPENIKLDALEYLLRKYTSFMPSATAFKSKNGIIKPNISLYEHLKTTSVFASAIASMNEENQQKVLDYYHKGTNTINNKVFLLIAGDFFGIQDFIFDEVQTKYAAKTLRAKSAYIQILVKVLAFYICERLGISKYSIISTHAGKFEILASNEKKIITTLKEIQKELNEFFLEEFFGQTGLGITWVEACIEDFLIKSEENRYKKLRKKLADRVEKTKFKKFNLDEIGYKLFDIGEGLNNQNLCYFCNKRKGNRKEEYVICPHCEKFVKIGKALTTSPFMAISKKRKSDDDIEVFKGFYLHFFENPSKIEAKEDVAIYDIKTDSEFRGFEKWELSSYVAVNEKNEILTFEELAKLSVKDGIKQNKRVHGVEAIMALKGDGDGIGNFIKNSDVTNSFAKYNFFARMMDYYFSVYVPIKFMQNKPLYTVFAGGDDLFVLGAWDEVIDLAKKTRDDFVKFTSNNLTFSTGLVMSKANKPVNFLAFTAEEALEEAKDFCCRVVDGICKEICNDKNCNGEDVREKDAMNLFGESVRWENFEKIRENLSTNLNKLPEEKLKTTFLYRLIELSEMSKKVFCEGDVQSTIWKSKLNYIFQRNIVEKNNSYDDLMNFLNFTIENYPKEFKLALFEFIYKRRK